MYQYFVDPVLRAPTIGSMFMCMSAALIGVIAFLRKESLIGESLSHAAYPGVILGILFSGVFLHNESDKWLFSFSILAGAFLSSLLGLWCIHTLVRKFRVASDAALCFILSSFFGIGLTLASRIQFTYSQLYQQMQIYLYGQAATMRDIHILIYFILSVAVIAVVSLFYKEIQVISFDRNYARTLGIPVRHIDTIVFIFITLAVVIGIRSVGIVLMSAMLIAPAIAARQFTHRLSGMFVISAFFGLASGFFGNFFSFELSEYFRNNSIKIALPTGPMIVLVASFICLFSLFFSPSRGYFIRLLRMMHFRSKCIGENLLKTLWRSGPNSELSIQQLAVYQCTSSFYLRWLLFRLSQNGWLERTKNNCYRLTTDGYQKAAHIVRLHRLWEVYLVDYLGIGIERVHKSAEEMEHIITPELEEILNGLLNNPKEDPHHQPIPSLDRFTPL